MYVCMYIYNCMYVLSSTLLFVSFCVCIYIYIYIYVCVYVFVFACRYTLYINGKEEKRFEYICKYNAQYIYIYIYIYMCVCVCVRVCVCLRAFECVCFIYILEDKANLECIERPSIEVSLSLFWPINQCLINTRRAVWYNTWPS